MGIISPAGANLRRAIACLMAAFALVGAGALPAAAVDNLPPDAVADAADATSGEPKRIDVLNNDSDPEDDPLTVTAVSDPPHGAAVVGASRDVVYTSDPGYTGTDSFTYTIEDALGNTDTATIQVLVHGCAPIAGAMDDDGIVVDEEWVRCSSYWAHDSVGDATPVMNPTNGSQALFTTGHSESSASPEDSEATTEWGTAFRGAHDVSVLRLDLDIPTGSDCLAFDLSFQTEEYPDNVDTQFNDGFLAELDVSNWQVDGSTITAPNNFAFDGSGNIVSVNSSFFDPERVVEEPGTTYNGSTPLLDARTPVTPGAHTLYLSIFDAADSQLDSAAYVDRLRAFDAVEGKCFRGAHQAPNAGNDTLTVNEDGQNSVNVLTNDVDMDGDPIEVSSNLNGTNGTASCTTAGVCTYTPNPNYFGTDSFTYRVTDGTGADTGTVNVTVNPMEDPPSAVDDSLTTSEDVAGTTNVLLNDLEPDGDPMTITSKTDGTNGSVSCSGGSCTYTPAQDFSGTDSFTYTISDGKAGTDTATVNVQVNPQNDPPVAVGDSLGVLEDGEATSVVTANDSDVDGDSLSVTSKTNGSHGSVTCSTTSCTYVPAANYYGTDSFTYTVSDGRGGTDTATVDVSVGAVQDAPDATNDSLTTAEDTAGTVNVLANDVDVDGDTKTITADTDGANGTVACTGNSCTYTPAANFNGSDSFTYTISDGNGGSDTATVTVTVNPVNDAPNAVGDELATDEDVAGQLNVTTNDSDVENHTLSVSSKTNGTHGTVSCSGQSCTYTPDADFNGTDSFTYTVSDGNGGTDTATVDVDVAAVNDDPQAVNDSTTVIEDTPKTVDVLANDADVDGDSLTITAETDGTNGSVVCSAASCTYTPNADYLGQDTFTYTVSDGMGGTDVATVSVTVKAPNVPPVAAVSPSTEVQTSEGQSVAFDGTGSTDSDGQVASYGWSVSDGRTFSGASPTIPFADNGTYDVMLEVCDNEAECDDVMVQVTVSNANPTASISSQPTTPLRIDTNKSPSTQPGAAAPFTVTASDPAGVADPLTYAWDFGDGTTEGPPSSASVAHAYKSLGTFTTSVAVTDDDGGSVSTQSQPVTVMATGKCGKLQKSYWGKPGQKVTVYAKTQFWYSKGRTQKPIRGKYIKPGQVVKLEPKPGSRTNFNDVCIKRKRYLRVEKVTRSLPSLKYEYLPESALVKL